MGPGITLKVLVVDDEAVVRDFLVRFLGLKDFAIEAKSAEDSFRALEMAKKERFDIFFVDVRMPKMSGLDTLKELRKVSPDGKFVMMTGYAVDDLVGLAQKELGAVASLRKPFNIEEVKALLNKICQDKK